MLKALLIDLDGTIADSLPYLYKSYETLLKKRGLTPSREEFIELTGATIEEAALFLENKYQIKDLYAEWKEILIFHYENEINPHLGVDELLAFAKGRFKLVLVTAAEEVFAKPFLKRHGFEFDELICKASKPSPEAYLTALRKLKIEPKEAIAIEDSKNGALSAIGAGIYTFLVSDQPVEKAHLVKNLDEITLFLKEFYG